MAVSTSNAYSGPYTANGSTTVFPFTFSAMTTADVAVLLRDADGVTTVADTADYTVSLTGDAPSAGSVTFAVAPATGYEVLPYLEPAFDQQTSFADGSAWKAAAVNNVNDRAALRDQVLRRDTLRSLMVPIDEEALPVASLADAEGMVLRVTGGRIEPWDADSFASDVTAAAQAQIADDLAASESARDAASGFADDAANSVGAVKQLVRFALQPDAGITEAAWYAEFFIPTDTEYTLIRHWIYLGTGTCTVSVNLDDENYGGPFTATTSPDSDVVSITATAGQRISFQFEDITGAPLGIAVQLEGLPT